MDQIIFCTFLQEDYEIYVSLLFATEISIDEESDGVRVFCVFISNYYAYNMHVDICIYNVTRYQKGVLNCSCHEPLYNLYIARKKTFIISNINYLLHFC